MSTPILTIAIPTFNRALQLRATLERLLPQVSEQVAVLLIDNCSKIPAAAALRDLGQDSNPQVRAHRNPVNVGLAANVTRCFELCETEWLVILGDDDAITPDYVSALVDGIDRFPGATFVNFSSLIHQHERDFTSDGLQEFIERFENWSNVLFLSCGIYNRTRLFPFIRFGHIYGITLAPHTAILLRALGEVGGTVVFLSRNVVSYCKAETPTWPRILLSNSTLLLDFVPSCELQRTFLGKLQRYYIPIRDIAEQLAEEAIETGYDQRFHFRLRSLFHTGPRPSLRDRLRDLILEYLVGSPRIMTVLSTKLRTLVGKERIRPEKNESSKAI